MEPNAQIHLFNSHTEAEEAIRELERAGFDIKKLSIIGKGYHTEEHAIGFYGVVDRIKSWGGTGAFWGAIWGLLLTPAVFFLPGLGLVAMAGPVVATLITSLEGAIVVGGLSSFGAVLMEWGIPHEHAIKYEKAISSDQYLLVVHGSADEANQASRILNRS
jgi:hypothetical protein